MSGMGSNEGRLNLFEVEGLCVGLYSKVFYFELVSNRNNDDDDHSETIEKTLTCEISLKRRRRKRFFYNETDVSEVVRYFWT